MIKSINPYTGETIKKYRQDTKSILNKKLKRAEKQYDVWRTHNLNSRAKFVRAVGQILRKNTDKYAAMITQEMGKPISQAKAEVEKCAWVCDYYADNAAEALQNEVIETDAYKSLVRYDPLGIILGVMPWNYPFWQVFRFAIPTLMAGNTVLLKHASNVMGCAELIEGAFNEAGFPEGCFQNLVISSKKVNSILKDDRVKAVSLTGSKPAGSAVASKASELIKPSVLELGGSNALVVFEDANLEETVKTCVQARFQNTGQSCIAGKRLLVQESVYLEFVEKFITQVRELKSGNPQDEDTFIGVMAREDLAEELEKQLEDSLTKGARLILGGKRRKTYFEPTVVIDVHKKARIFEEETFGPVMGITPFKTDLEAIDLVNRSKFGLGVSIFTEDYERAEALIGQFDDGAVFVNELVKSDPRLPFGGTKESGYGRELGTFGIKEFVNAKTVYFKKN